MRRILAILAAVGLAAAPAQAQQTFFGEDTEGASESSMPNSFTNSNTAESNFLANLIGVGTETFESFADGTASPLGLTFPGAGTATLTGGGEIEDFGGGVASGRYAISGTRFWETSAGESAFAIDFSAPIAAFGFYGVDIGDFGGQLTLNFLNGGSLVESLLVNHTVNGTGGEAFFQGYINTANLYDRVEFSLSTAGEDFFAFDDMTIGSVEQVRREVPEPGTLILLGTGLLGIGVTAVRRRERDDEIA